MKMEMRTRVLALRVLGHCMRRFCGIRYLYSLLLLLIMVGVLGYIPRPYFESWPSLGGHTFFMIPERILSPVSAPLPISFDLVILFDPVTRKSMETGLAPFCM